MPVNKFGPSCPYCYNPIDSHNISKLKDCLNKRRAKGDLSRLTKMVEEEKQRLIKELLYSDDLEVKNE